MRSIVDRLLCIYRLYWRVGHCKVEEGNDHWCGMRGGTRFMLCCLTKGGVQVN